MVALPEASSMQDSRKIGSPRPNAGEGLGVRGTDSIEWCESANSVDEIFCILNKPPAVSRSLPRPPSSALR